MLARKKSSRFIKYKFTSNLKIFALLLLMTLVVKFGEKYVHGSIIKYFESVSEWRIGRVSGWEARDSLFASSLC